jgi:GT2 family glycosyltransferase
MPPLVSVTVVTYNSERFIGACLRSIFSQQYPELEVVVVDNASQDATREILANYADQVRIIHNRENVGFAAGHNQAIAASSGEWVLVLNPDVQLTPGFIRHLVEAAAEHADDGVGVCCGKLLVMTEDMTFPAHPLTDSAGIYFTPTQRHFDRGARQPANGQYDKLEFVFGASAAAALYSRRMIDDISVDGEFFDADFFMYREDADVAWRAQIMGWKCLYVPHAPAYHVRTAHSWNRSQLPPEINMHSVKNRFLMRLKNMGPGLYLRYLLPITLRDVGVVAYCLLVERTSLPAFRLLARRWRRALQKRRWIQARRRVSDGELSRWFRYTPVAYPVPPSDHISIPAGTKHRVGVSS